MILELCSCFVYFVPQSWGCCLVAKCFSDIHKALHQKFWDTGY